MNISYKWLKEYVDFTLTPQETADALTSIGLEVDALEEVQTIKGGLKGLFVGQVLSCEAHPNSDHLHITQVDLGRDVSSQIVCGAANVAAGQKVIVADLGCVLYDGDESFTIKKSKLRGVESMGMICAEDEIGVGSSHDGIIVLPDDAVVGTPAAEYYHVESDWLIEIDITANRGDALSHYGVARDLYAWLKQNGYKTRLHRPDCEAFCVDNESLPVAVEIENREACKRYACVSISNCDIKESPEWLQNKLRTVGLRPINNIVDITNYVMMAYGQPMHCFDADMVEGHQIVVRTEPQGTPFVTLDGEERTLDEHDLCICNAREPMCIAGVLGGKGSGTYATTHSVVLEAAYFHPTWIRKTARRHGLSTDASYRFERGINPDDVVYALKQAAILCKELTGGQVSMSINDVYPSPIEGSRVSLSYDYVHRLIGKEIGADTIKRIAESLEMRVLSENEEGLELLVPAYRSDVQRPCDVVEDILRIYGYNNVEISNHLSSALVFAGEEDESHHLRNLIAEQLVGNGFYEILNNSLTKLSYYAGREWTAYPDARTVKIMNPLSTDLGVMRQTMLFGGLESLVRNINRKNSNLRFFEFGNVYQYTKEKWESDHPDKAYSQDLHLSLWLTGKQVEGSWLQANADSSVFELKAYLHNIFVRVGVPVEKLSVATNENNIFSAGLTYSTRNGKVLAEIGVLSSAVCKEFSIGQAVYYADVDWEALMREVRKQKVEYQEISKYPAVSRDLALLLDKNVSFAQIVQIAKQTEKKLLQRVELFDVYEGKNLLEGKKSYAVNFILQDAEKTLNDKAIDAIMQKLIKQLTTQLGAELR